MRRIPDNAYARLAQRLFASRQERAGRRVRWLARMLPSANIRTMPHTYWAVAAFTALLVAVGTAALGGVAAWVFAGWDAMAWPFAVAAATGLLAGAVTYHAIALSPALFAAERASNIDDHLPFALNYMASVSSGGPTIDFVLERVASQDIYGQVSVEMGRLRRDMNLLGLDVMSALANAIHRSPSKRLRDVLQGLATTIVSGADVATYLAAKADELFQEHKTRHRKRLEDLGLLAELFVVLVVAVPVLLLVLLVSLVLFGRAGGDIASLGYRIFGILVPGLQAAFLVAIGVFTPAR